MFESLRLGFISIFVWVLFMFCLFFVPFDLLFWVLRLSFVCSDLGFILIRSFCGVLWFGLRDFIFVFLLISLFFRYCLDAVFISCSLWGFPIDSFGFEVFGISWCWFEWSFLVLRLVYFYFWTIDLGIDILVFVLVWILFRSWCLSGVLWIFSFSTSLRLWFIFICIFSLCLMVLFYPSR